MIENLHGLADAYLRQYGKRNGEDWRAFARVEEVVHESPELGWQLTLLLIDKAPDDVALAYVAAGPLEDLLKLHGAVIWDRVEEESDRHPRLQLALSGVWGLQGENRKRWERLMKKYQFADGTRAGL